MRKSSPNSSKGPRSGSDNTFKKYSGAKGPEKDAKPFKKNYDGRAAAPGASGAGPSRPSRPYSGRLADNSKPYPKDSGKPKRSFGKSSDGDDRRGAGDEAGQRPRKEFDKPFRKDDNKKTFSDRPKRSFDKSPRGEDRPRRADEAGQKPRKSFDKPYGKDDNKKPFGDRPKRSFDKPSFKKDEGRSSGDDSGYKPRKEFDKPYRKGDDKKPFSDRPKKSFDKPFKKDDSTGSGDDAGYKPRKEFDKPYRKDDNKKPFSDRPKKSFDKPSFKKDDRTGEGEERKPARKFDKPVKSGGDSRPFRDREKPAYGDRKAGGKKEFEKNRGSKGDKENTEAKSEKKTFSDVVKNAFNAPPKKIADEDNPGKRQQFEDQVYGELEDVVNEDRPKKPFEIKKRTESGKKKHVHDHSEGRKKKYKDEDEDDEDADEKDDTRTDMPLNKFIAHSGECSRRDAAELVRQGKVKVNEELVLDPGYRVQPEDKVTMSGKKLVPQRNMVYILLNKPKGYITTNEDPQGRKTVMELVGNAGVDRLFPVGRLDRDTSGLLLITNDGELTQKLCHPAYNIKKVYQVTLDKPLTKADFEKILEGVELEDGKAPVDALAYLEKKNELGLEIHSGKNRIVRRIFESLGYVVDKLDRMMYAGLTKKNLPRSKWRYLNEREIVLLKHFKS